MLRLLLVLNLILCFQLGAESTYGKNSEKGMLVSKLTIEKVLLEKINNSSIRVSVDVKIILKNCGMTRIFLLNQLGFPHFESGFILSESNRKLRLGKSLASAFNGESVDTSEKWKLLAKELDTPKPNPSIFLILDVNESRKFEKKLIFYLPLTDKNKSISEYESWERIKSLPSVSLQILGSSWSDNIDRASNNLSKILRERWGQDGYLWTDSITTEATPLEFGINPTNLSPSAK